MAMSAWSSTACLPSTRSGDGDRRRNVISGNGVDGIEIINAGDDGQPGRGQLHRHRRQPAPSALGNAPTACVLDTAAGNTIGGTRPGRQRHLGQQRRRHRSSTAGATGNLVQGNFIGTNAAGATGLGNANVGVDIDNGAGQHDRRDTASGAATSSRGNDRRHRPCTSTGTTGNVVQGNFIGTNAAGAAGLGNGERRRGDRVRRLGQHDRRHGGGAATSSPRLPARRCRRQRRHNATDTGTGNAILGNSIFSNAGFGIDLGNDGVTLNTSGGPTPAQPPPELPRPDVGDRCRGHHNHLPARSTARPTPPSPSSSSPTPPPIPPASARASRILGQTSVTTDGCGNASFSVPLSTPLWWAILHRDGDRPEWQYVGVLPGHLERHHGHEHQRQRPRLAPAGDPQRQR